MDSGGKAVSCGWVMQAYRPRTHETLFGREQFPPGGDNTNSPQKDDET